MLLEAGNMEHLYAVSKQSFFVWYAGTSTKTFCMKLQEDWASYAFRAITMSEAGKPLYGGESEIEKRQGTGGSGIMDCPNILSHRDSFDPAVRSSALFKNL